MKNILLALSCCCMLQTSAQPTQTSTGNMSITVQEGIELLSVVQYLGCQLSNSTPSSYKQELKKYFLLYRTHAAVTTMFMFGQTIYPDLTEFGLLFYNFPNIKMKAMPDSSTWYRHIPRPELEKYFQQCMQFYKDSKFHTFYSSHQADYAAWGSALQKKMDDPVKIFSDLFDTKGNMKWSVFLDPLNDWGAHTIVPSKLSAGLKNNIMYQVGYFGDKDSAGNMVFKMDVYDFTWHEGAHAISDAILTQYYSQIDSLSYLMKGDAALQKQNINDWHRYFDELVARSVSIALHKEYRSTADYEKLLQFEASRGFTHVRTVSDVVYNEFVHQKNVKSFEEVFPKIFEALRAQYH
ncbi:MAG: DUF4932 domain-containing protein [Chitinophagaceae bacterium]